VENVLDVGCRATDEAFEAINSSLVDGFIYVADRNRTIAAFFSEAPGFVAVVANTISLFGLQCGFSSRFSRLA
jgi:hypothetical protein